MILDQFGNVARFVGAGIRAGRTEEAFATAHRYAEASAESLARYDRKGGG